MIDNSVPVRSSLWSGTGTVRVVLASDFCIIMWLLRRRTSVKPCCASIPQTSWPDNTLSLANRYFHLGYIHLGVEPLFNLGG